MGNKHKHYDMIVAKAANMSLVKFIKMDGEWESAGLSDKFISFSEEYDYFLCLPQHKEACLHWLGGGNIQYRIALDAWTDAAGNVSNAAWTPDSLFIDDQVEFRIKPKEDSFSEALSSIDIKKPISNNEREELIYKLIEAHYGNGFLFKFGDLTA